MEIIYSSKFSREYKKLPMKIKMKAEEREKLFRQNPHDLKLNTHKLHGRLNEFWSFSIGDKYMHYKHTQIGTDDSSNLMQAISK